MYGRKIPRGLVSIMMPAYNAEDYIEQAIESALSQTYSNWELIIVNDGSTDRTADTIRKYTDPRIRVFHQENKGEASARNTALRNAQGEWISFLDADDLYLPEHLEETLNYFQSHSECNGVYTNGYYIDQNGVQLKTLSSRRRGPFEGDIFEEVVRSSDVFGAPVCVVLRRNLIDQYGLEFDPSIVIGPDWDFLTRYSEIAQFGYIDQFTCLYRVHQTNISLRTNLQRRALSLASCREKAIKLHRFSECSVETRAFVFYDLLVNLLTGFPERQLSIAEGEEFRCLSVGSQARLFRLMASKALLSKEANFTFINKCFHLSRKLNPSDKRSAFLYSLYYLSPKLCKTLLKARKTIHKESSNISPFGSLTSRSPQAKDFKSNAGDIGLKEW